MTNEARKIRNVSVIFLYDDNGKILLQHRGPEMKVPNKWAFFGGKIEEGETSLKAVVREIKEELNYDLKKPKFIAKHDFIYANLEGTLYGFIERYDGSELTQLEGDGMGWYTFSEAFALGFTEPDETLLKKIEKRFDAMKDKN